MTAELEAALEAEVNTIKTAAERLCALLGTTLLKERVQPYDTALACLGRAIWGGLSPHTGEGLEEWLEGLDIEAEFPDASVPVETAPDTAAQCWKGLQCSECGSNKLVTAERPKVEYIRGRHVEIRGLGDVLVMKADPTERKRVRLWVANHMDAVEVLGKEDAVALDEEQQGSLPRVRTGRADQTPGTGHLRQTDCYHRYVRGHRVVIRAKGEVLAEIPDPTECKSVEAWLRSRGDVLEIIGVSLESPLDVSDCVPRCRWHQLESGTVLYSLGGE